MRQKNHDNLDKLIYIEEQICRTEKQTLKGFDPKHRNIVDYIIGITFDIWENKGIGEIYNTYTDDVSMHLGLSTYSGIGRVIAATLDTLQAFPNRIPFGEEVIWAKSGKAGEKFFSSHRLGSTATHLGAHQSYGAATGKKIFFRTVADCTIANNKVEEEWLIRDNYYIITQLGLDPVAMAKEAGTYQQPVQDRRALRSENAIPQYDIAQFDAFAFNASGGDASVQLVLSLFKEIFCNNFFNRLNEFYERTALLHSICERKYGGIPQIRDYFVAFFAALPQAHVRLDRITCNKGATDKVAVRWTISGEHKHCGLFGPPSDKMIYVVGVTHFEIAAGKIQQQWDVFDLFDVLCQIHAQNSPELSAPFSSTQLSGLRLPGHVISTDARTQTNKKTALAYIEAIKQNQTAALPGLLAQDLRFNASRPFRETQGIAAFVSEFWQPLHNAFPDLSDEPYILMGGEANGNECVSTAGNFIGTFEREWLGIPPSRQCVWLRYQSHMQFQNGKITKIWYLIDILDVMRQAGYDLFPSRGASVLVPPPMNGDGIITAPLAAEQGRQTLQLVSDMLAALLRYDGTDYASMGDLAKYWHEKDMLWYGPSGIGSTKGLAGFQTYHQFPFLQAFPNRGISARGANDDSASYAEGNYACDFGFPSMYGTHNGDGWLGLSATGKKCTMRVMDFWRREGARLKENWVMIDLIDILEQLGTDVFALLREARAKC